MKPTFVALALVLSAPAWAQVPSQLGYEGRLLEADGGTTQGVHQFVFSLWPSSSGGTAPLWSDTYKVAVVDGLYSVQLGGDADADGGVNPLPSSVFDGTVLHLEITVDGETLSPRQPVGSVAYAIKAGTATTATNLSGGTIDATSVNVNGNQVVDGTGHLTGAAAADFLKTAATSAPLTGNGTSSSPIGIPQCTSLVDGYLSAADWNTFNIKLTTVTASAPLSGAGTSANPLMLSQSSASSDGYLSATDWNTFNNKVSATDPRLADARNPLPGSANYIQANPTSTQNASFDVSSGSLSLLNVGTSNFSSYQGGAIELGGNNGAANPIAGGVPYIDFHYGTGAVQDYNVRIINDADGRLHLAAPQTYLDGIAGIGTSNTTSPASSTSTQPFSAVTILNNVVTQGVSSNAAAGVDVTVQNGWGGTISSGYGYIARFNQPTSWQHWGNLYAFYAADRTHVANADLYGTAYGIYVEPSYTNYFGGNVGIGTTAPQTPLQVTAGGNVGGAGGAIGFGANPQDAPMAQIKGLLVYATGSQDQGSLAFYTRPFGTTNQALTERMRIDLNGAVGIGTASPSVEFQVGNSGDGTVARANAWTTFSDARFKTDVATIDNASSLIEQLRGVTFRWKQSDEPSTGFIAQEVEKILPEIVFTDSNGYKSVDYAKVTPVLVEALKAQQAEIDQAKAQNAALNARLDRLERVVRRLSAHEQGGKP